MSIRKVILVVLATLVIFAAGVLTGGVLVKRLAVEPRQFQQPASYFPGRFDQVRRALNDVDLTHEQRVKVDGIIRLSQEEIADYFLILAPDFQTVFGRMRDNILAELEPPQRRRFDELMKKRLLRSPMVPNGERQNFQHFNNGNPQNRPGTPPRERLEHSLPDGTPRRPGVTPVPQP